jgi:hypothetical protein
MELQNPDYEGAILPLPRTRKLVCEFVRCSIVSLVVCYIIDQLGINDWAAR